MGERGSPEGERRPKREPRSGFAGAGRPRPLGARTDGPIGSRLVAYQRCPTCKRTVRADYLVRWREVRRGSNGHRGYRRPYYVQLCWRCLIERAERRE